MKKTILTVLCLCLCLLFLCSSLAFGATEAETTDQANYIVKRLPYDNGGKEVSYAEQIRLFARYADTKEPIALSEYYDGAVCATIPASEADRDLEIFVAAEPSFSDIDKEYMNSYLLQPLAGTGVLQGINGKLLPERTLTRAEAVTLIARVLGLDESDSQLPFNDVPADAWYAQSLAVALEHGVISPAEQFRPNAKVTRQEFTVMVARAFRTMGLLRDPSEEAAEKVLAEIDDRTDIAAYALADYAALGHRYTSLYDYETGTEFGEDGFPESFQYARPTQEVSRENAATLIYRAIQRLPVWPSALAVEYGFDKEMPVVDGSTSTYPFTRAVYNMLFYNGENHAQYPEKHSKSHVSYQRLIHGEVDMIFASVYPASDILEMAKEVGVEIELIPIAYDAQVFFTNSANSIEGLTTEQISNIYVNNAYANWKELGGPDATLLPYCRNNDSGSHAQMERHFLNGKEIHADIRVENTSLTMSSIITEVIDAGQDDPPAYALGYSIYYYYRNMMDFMIGPDADGNYALKLLVIDGVYPTDETIADGSYPLSNNTYIAIRKDTAKDALARTMADFMLTPKGQQCVENAGFGPLTPNKTE